MPQRHTLHCTVIVLALLTAAGVARRGEFPPAIYSASAGGSEWTLQFAKDGNVTVRRGAEVAVEGEYTTEGDVLRVVDKAGPMACPADQPGEYKWKLDGTKLTLTLVQDGCEGRSQAFTKLQWTRTAE